MQMQRLAKAGVRVAVVRGNHDAANTMTRSLIMPDNVKIFLDRKPETWLLDDLGIAIHGQSYATQEITENLAAAYPEPVPGVFNVGVLHCLISGAAGHLPYAPCTLDQLGAKGYDYWALGHVHEHTVVRSRPMIVYAGCSQGRHIREIGEKGCVLVESVDGFLRADFVPLDVVRWVRMTVDISASDDISQVAALFADALEDGIANLDGRICCARVILKGRCPVHGRLHADPETLTANLRAVASDVSHRKVWLEKVVLDTGPEFDLSELEQSDTPQGELLRLIQELSASSRLFEDLGMDFSQLKAKLAGSGVPFPQDDGKDMLPGVRDMLLTMLADIQAGEGRP
jgi:DNA repair exonuclease SbcCD nuclease subunit